MEENGHINGLCKIWLSNVVQLVGQEGSHSILTGQCSDDDILHFYTGSFIGRSRYLLAYKKVSLILCKKLKEKGDKERETGRERDRHMTFNF